METIVAFIALAIAAVGARLGMAAGALPSLRRMLASIFALLVTMRYWYLVAHGASRVESASLAILASATFWVLFVFVWFVAARLSETYFEAFEPVRLSVPDRIFGTLFGFVTGSVIAASLLLTIALIAPSFLPMYHRDAIPMALDTTASNFYRLVEIRLARPPEDGRTRLPSLPDAGADDPSKFWQ